jgi:serine/threonine protein kinase
MYDFVFVYCFVDIIKKAIGDSTTSSVVYEAVIKELNEKVAIKVFLPTDDSKFRDFEIGLNECFFSDYTLGYYERLIFEEYLCVSMKLMEGSLQKFLDPLITKTIKDYFDDDV